MCTRTPASLMDAVCRGYTHVLLGVKLNSRGYGVCSKPIKVRPRWESPVPLCLGQQQWSAHGYYDSGPIGWGLFSDFTP